MNRTRYRVTFELWVGADEDPSSVLDHMQAVAEDVARDIGEGEDPETVGEFVCVEPVDA